ncbi:hypothetical protein SDC9_192449 [bioreactor metagenome]|uniref:Uncharacterized protein n=1 Tax=bioreactor metagenome TaxID=1076179 RepID=A0A645I2A9_9ZZZZ
MRDEVVIFCMMHCVAFPSFVFSITNVRSSTNTAATPRTSTCWCCMRKVPREKLLRSIKAGKASASGPHRAWAMVLRISAAPNALIMGTMRFAPRTGRYTVRSIVIPIKPVAKPARIIQATKGSPRDVNDNAMKVPNTYRSPCAKFTWYKRLYTMLYPTAIIAYMLPKERPLMS